MPLAGSRVSHPRWSEHHRPTATSAMTADCVFTRRAGEGATGPDGTYTPPEPAEIYAGPCRVVEQRTAERIAIVGAARETHRRYLVAIRHDAPEIHVGDVGEITRSADAGLVGKRVRVVDVQFGNEQWQRDLYCDELEGVEA
jgi:hypothetical protein